MHDLFSGIIIWIVIGNLPGMNKFKFRSLWLGPRRWHVPGRRCAFGTGRQNDGRDIGILLSEYGYGEGLLNGVFHRPAKRIGWGMQSLPEKKD
ncbi:MAG: hypothetical protein DWQ05_00885 [Calditrichaeota bacterium]|nr:MAG: hypothetical protein DWQ05_00885 [Calditrichota bacterium]